MRRHLCIEARVILFVCVASSTFTDVALAMNASSQKIVYIHANYNTLSKVDPISKNFHSDLYLDSTWIDDSLANQSVPGTKYDSANLWMPMLEICKHCTINAKRIHQDMGRACSEC